MGDAAGNIIGLYERFAAAWDKARGKNLFERAWLERFCALIPAGGKILDLGCGAGEPIARYFIEAGYRVTGADSSPSMIALCRERFPDAEWIVADMRRLALDGRFDGILAWDSFFHLTHEDQAAMFPLFAKHAAQGAALMFTSGRDHGVAMGEFEGEPLFHASLDPGEYRRLLAENGFEAVAQVFNDPGCGGHSIWLARRA
ncbi:MAG TPA: class I SAM-dependent methyltransferase [Xanthobacteraceae bacterium]|nr:class I SAM-dependent methyltransferase [Xanthobacteraceae bacterium]